MIELQGKYNKDCKIYTDDLEENAYSTIYSILDHKISENLPIRIMPDVHDGKSIVIGFTMPLNPKMIIPAHIGVDIGCGMLSAKFKASDLDVVKIDKLIKERIPFGFNINERTRVHSIDFSEVNSTANIFIQAFNQRFNTNYSPIKYDDKWLKDKLKKVNIGTNTFYKSIGTIGGGNHFIECGIDSDNNYWITIHTGSRNFGLKIENYWSNVGKDFKKNSIEYNKQKEIILNQSDKTKIHSDLKKLNDEWNIGVSNKVPYLVDENMIGYLSDMIFAQYYAHLNRQIILEEICKILGIQKYNETIETIHNYIDFNDFIIRKGAIASYTDRKMIIPFNMRDGLLICKGKSNKDWNYSAPHGAGRIMSRSRAKELIKLNDFENTMKNVYSTSICSNTIDESPFAYKSSEFIEKAVEPTAIILDKVKPILNIKAT